MREQYQGRSVVVTGGAGAIGSRLVDRLVDLGCDVLVLDDYSSGHEWKLPADASVVVGDVAREEDVEKAFADEPSAVFHLAAFFANQNSVDHPLADLETNGRGTLTLLQKASECETVDHFVYASSSCVYDHSMELPYEESETVQLTYDTPYEITKTVGEAYCNYFEKKRGLSVSRARIFNSYGPGEVPGTYRNVIPNFINYAMQGQPLPITGSGEETRDFTYVGDIVDGLMSLGTHPDAAGEVFNLGRGEETTISTLAETVNAAVGNEGGVEYKPRREWDNTDRRRASIDKAVRILDYHPEMDLETGIERTVAWFEQNWDRIQETTDL